MIPAGFLGEVGSWATVVLGVGLLIFIHEAGHFLVAKWAGVKVLAFSLGFGPEVWGFTRGTTRYRIGWLPLGGYVKMSGEVERVEGGYAPDDYPAKPVGVRACIIGAGVAMNAVLAFFLFGAAFAFGLPPVVIGTVALGSPAAAAGVRPGDRLVGAGGDEVFLFGDLTMATFQGAPLDLDLERDGKPLRVRVVPAVTPGRERPEIGVSPGGASRLKVDPKKQGAAAGFRDGDTIVSVEGIPARLDDLLDGEFLLAVAPKAGPLRIGVSGPAGSRVLSIPPEDSAPRIGISPWRGIVGSVRPDGVAAAAGWREGDRPIAVLGASVEGARAFRRAVLRSPPGPGIVRVSRDREIADLPLPADPGARLELVRDLYFAPGPSPTTVEVDPEGPPGPGGEPRPSPAAAAGIPSGARITAVAGKKVETYAEVMEGIQAAKKGSVEIAWTRDGKEARASATPVVHAEHSLGGLGLVPEPDDLPVVHPGLLDLPRLAFGRCVSTTDQILVTIGGLFGGKVRKEELGGPIFIAQVARSGLDSGPGHFLMFLAVISINLMFLNILPIPLLDGGQLALLGVEAVTRKPPSEAVVGISQMVGLVLLLALMAMVTFNDILRNIGR